MSILGDRDEYIDEARISAERERLREAEIPVELVRYAGGHRIHPTLLQRSLLDGCAELRNDRTTFSQGDRRP